MFYHIKSNLYVQTIPLIKGAEYTEIEDLYPKETLETIIDGRTFNRDGKADKTKYYNKDIFSKYILKNYTGISFDNFIPLLDTFSEIIGNYNSIKSMK